ncbi:MULTISPECIES: hypothetical protein [Acinetobacter]|uniref:Uncharacterized protein n=1 Tax=Acinetobacter baylyi (strain ATCC 33305 / BD413 / ADP1) TaxID=62977 RepID=Q6F791_ACIAD|nr:MULTISPECIES: hypothetical protein [Acinetobacter]ENV54950.1 hypothetical protein F952_00667 [Acinetobacter baylyi DSM 14961 = CIP 107474]KAF2371097.1 hypothetical protein BSL88_07620 [Acinetobacter baylyi]KAF2374694.1 hypothetical protein BSL67_05165 [Acinetobacter baylyi]KAF2377619.1 hypothetical protein BSN81_07775 [Acinetobacter baylyi]KAF2381827.1 hypothetical protein BSN83_05005 [Acinetobacter baylyi]
MHDWTLVSINILWKEDSIKILFYDSCSNHKILYVNGFTKIVVPKLNEWERSISVYEVNGPNKINESCYSFYIHMQSGDIIEIEGKNIEIIDN